MSGCTGACHSGGGCTCTRIAEPVARRLDHPDEQLALMASEDIAREASEVAFSAEGPHPHQMQAFSQNAYNQITGNLDAIITFMMTEFGKTEAEAQAWLQSFVTHHYFPVWRAMNKKD